jgi:hypothetical protein
MQSATKIAHQILESVSLFHKENLDQIVEDIATLVDRLHSNTAGPHRTNYKIEKWADQIAKFQTGEKVLSLRNEIGVLRITVEMEINRCTTPAQLITKASVISDQIAKIARLVESCHKLENSMGLLLDKEAAMQFTNELITVVGNYVKDPDTLLSIANHYNDPKGAINGPSRSGRELTADDLDSDEQSGE